MLFRLPYIIFVHTLGPSNGDIRSGLPQAITMTGFHSNQDPSFTRKPIYSSIFTESLFGPDYCFPIPAARVVTGTRATKKNVSLSDGFP